MACFLMILGGTLGQLDMARDGYHSWKLGEQSCEITKNGELRYLENCGPGSDVSAAHFYFNDDHEVVRIDYWTSNSWQGVYILETGENRISYNGVNWINRPAPSFEYSYFPPGDSNLSGEFDSGDLVHVFQRGRYETNEGAFWSDGDWNLDFVFSTSDLIYTFQKGTYQAQAANVVPEPRIWPVWAFLALVGLKRRVCCD